MSIRSLLLENYRSFRDRQEIELAPITIVLGKNNTGKSALVRLPLVLATGFEMTSSAPLDLEQLGPDTVDDFLELFFDQRSTRLMTVGLSRAAAHPFAIA